MKITYKTKGTCSQMIELEINNGIISNIRFTGGCNGNTKGVSILAEGMKAEDLIARCSGITCGPRPTSCPDQLARAVAYAVEQEKASGQNA